MSKSASQVNKRLISKLVPLAFMVLLLNIGAASSPTQQAYVKASNTDAGDQFGFRIAVSGDTMVISAPQEGSNADGVNGDQTNNTYRYFGAAYVFVRQGTNWTQQAYLKASNSQLEDFFGYSVAISGDTIVIGSPHESSGGNGNGVTNGNWIFDLGAAYVFVRNGTNWTQEAFLKASNTHSDPYRGFYFGWSVSIYSNTIVVGAHEEPSNATGVNGNQADTSAYQAGAAYVFVRNGNTWSQQAYLKASNTGTGDRFGEWAAVSGDTIVVGAPNEDSNATGVNGNQTNNAAMDSGAAYIFVRNGNTWSQQAYLKASNANQNDFFGYAVAVSGDTVVIGAPYERGNSTGVNGSQAVGPSVRYGAAYVFVRSGNSWSQEAYLKAGNDLPEQQFGSAVAVAGDIVVIGSRQENGDAAGVNGTNTVNGDFPYAGAVTTFIRNGTNWSQSAYLKASNPDSYDQFGYSVAVSGDTMVTGARDEASDATGVNGSQTNNLAGGAGAVYVFTGFGLSVPSPPRIVSPAALVDGASFTIVASTNVSLALTNWTVLGPATEISLGLFRFTDSQATNFPQRFYTVRSP